MLYEAEHGSLDGLHELLDEEFLKRGLPFEPGVYEGEASPTVVLGELFTGADCGPCLAADFAFDGLIEHYPDTELAVLEYHLHIPRPDPMTNAASLARKEYYGVNSTPQAPCERMRNPAVVGSSAIGMVSASAGAAQNSTVPAIIRLAMNVKPAVNLI